MDLIKEIQTKDRFTFVADFVVFMTRKKANRELVSGYQVKRNQNGEYKIFLDGMDAAYGWMSAEKINSWFVRLSLNYFSMQAEQMYIEYK